MRQIWGLVMLDCFSINSALGNYDVCIDNDIVDKELKQRSPCIIICDQFLENKYLESGYRVVGIPALESEKSLERMSDHILALKALGANRQSKIIAIGGGVIQDIATFLASTYMRGLEWIYLPTTLLGMVDSCIGGKSSINVGQYKNLIGNFYPAKKILIDLKFIDTLNSEQRIAGLLEAVKICFASENDSFERFLVLEPNAGDSIEHFKKVINLALQTKKWFIEVDEYDAKERLLLNFGHTFGHAIEGASEFFIPHGIAVGMGMLVAVSFAQGYWPSWTENSRVSNLKKYTSSILRLIPKYQEWIDRISVDQLMDRFRSDKKHSETHFVLIIPDVNGFLVRVSIDKNRENEYQLMSSFSSILLKQ